MSNRNETLFEKAKQYIPGGVNSPVRAFSGVGGIPRFIKKAKGPFVWDENGTRYIDYVGSWGPAILGHAHPEVIDAVQKIAADGLSFGAPTKAEIDIARTICNLVESIEQVRLVSSGTEAVMSAIRLARGYTQRDMIVKFEGCYHGHSDSLLVKAGSGLLTFGNPSSTGIPGSLTKHTLVLPYNNVAALEQAFDEYADMIACVIVEPIAGNMNMVVPSDDFVRTLREITTKNNSLLIYDEVMTGFRVALGGAQSLQNIRPDLTTLGKIIGGGMPLAAFGGRKEIMAQITPLGTVYQAGTLSGNPVAVAAGLSTLKLIQAPDFYHDLSRKTSQLCRGLNRAADRAGISFCSQSLGGIFGLYFNERVPESYAQMQQSSTKMFAQFFHGMLQEGISFGPSAFEAGFVSSAHTDEVIEQTIAAAERVFAKLLNDQEN